MCVIDGDPAVRDSLATLIAVTGHQVQTFASGREFLSRMPELGVACVVCEADLPDTSGIELFHRFRSASPGIRFALLMSRTDPAAAARAASIGVDAILHKPLVHRRLTRFVGSV